MYAIWGQDACRDRAIAKKVNEIITKTEQDRPTDTWVAMTPSKNETTITGQFFKLFENRVHQKDAYCLGDEFTRMCVYWSSSTKMQWNQTSLKAIDYG